MLKGIQGTQAAYRNGPGPSENAQGPMQSPAPATGELPAPVQVGHYLAGEQLC